MFTGYFCHLNQGNVGHIVGLPTNNSKDPVMFLLYLTKIFCHFYSIKPKYFAIFTVFNLTISPFLLH